MDKQIVASCIEYMGSDHTITNSARVSFAKHEYPEYDEDTATYILSEKDTKLISYLAKHRHMSPFGHNFATFHCKAPVFVARQLVKHKFLRWNEISRRYVDDKPKFYTPLRLRERSKDKKQGSGKPLRDCGLAFNILDDYHQRAVNDYDRLLAEGVCPEQARMILPQSMITEWYWSGSMDAFSDMCNLRTKSDTQYETRVLANQIDSILEDIWPIGWKALRC